MSIHNALVKFGYQDTSERFLSSHEFSSAEFEEMFTESYGSVDFQDLYISPGCLKGLDILITNPFFPFPAPKFTSAIPAKSASLLT